MILFICGFISNILATIDIQAIQRGESFKSGLATFLLLFLNYAVFYNIINSPEAYFDIVIYAFGGGFGAFITVKYAKYRTRQI